MATNPPSDAPGEMISVGKPDHTCEVGGKTYKGVLYKQGICKKCLIALYGFNPMSRDVCGEYPNCTKPEDL